MELDLTDGAKRTLTDAVALATASEHVRTEPPHLLLALLDRAAALLRAVRADPADLRAEAAALAGRPSATVSLVRSGPTPPLSRAGVAVMRAAARHARELGDPAISAGHMLIALAEEGDGCGALLARHGADVPSLREAFVRFQAAAAQAASGHSRPPHPSEPAPGPAHSPTPQAPGPAQPRDPQPSRPASDPAQSSEQQPSRSATGPASPPQPRPQAAPRPVHPSNQQPPRPAAGHASPPQPRPEPALGPAHPSNQQPPRSATGHTSPPQPRPEMAPGPAHPPNQQPSRPAAGPASSSQPGPARALPSYLADLAAGREPVLGRDEVIRRLVGVLGRRDRGNPLLVGESGVGKSAVLGGLAHALAPVRLLALTGPVADRAAFRAALADGAVVALDDLHTAVASDGSLPDLLAWLLADAGVRVVATVTPAGHRAWAERLPGLFRHFRPVPLDEPDLDATVAILRGLRPRYEEHHRLAIGDDALVAAAALAGRHVTAGFQPEKAIDLLDEAAARHRLGGGARPGAEAPPDLVAEALAGHAGLLRVLAEARQRRQAEAAKLAGLVERRRAQAEQARRAGDRAEEERLTGTVLPALERRLAATVQLTAGDVAEVVPAPPTSTLLLPGADELEPGDPRALGRYRIVRRIGAGGQGVVYLGEDASGGQVAIKVLRAEVTRSPQAHDRFQREVAAARRVASFCTAQVLESGFEGRRPYVVSEFVDGPSLREAIAVRGTRSGAALDRLAIGTITALAAIAEAGIVHRDFKPDNVLLAPDGPRVIDFGVARALDAASLTGQAIGTPAYMAPEQVRGGAVGPAADVYAWACTLVYAALGRPPHGADGVQQVMHRKLYGEPDLAGFAEAASAPLADLVVRSLARDPAARPTAERILFRLLGRDDPADGGLLAEGAAVATRVNE